MKTRRSAPEFWAENIIECESLCKDAHEAKHFYSYITNPHKYSYEEAEKMLTLGDLEKCGQLPAYEPADERQTAEVFKNGNEYKIFVRTKPVAVLVEDEKNPQ